MSVELAARFVHHMAALGVPAEGDGVLVACSGGLDSNVLLHLLRFTPGVPRLALAAAHFDHRMRAGSAADALWIRGLCAAWGVPLVAGAAERAPHGEAEARRERYRFLRDARQRLGSRWLLTAHHADDQAETVLFRVLRGSGVAGLRGIPERGPGGLLRPLLPYRRSELDAYAAHARVPWRPDPTNLDVRFARNVLRHEILPRAEAAVAPGARGALVRLSRVARREEGAWRSLLPGLMDRVGATVERDAVTLARPAFLAEHPGVRARVLREAVRRLGGWLDEAGTLAALEFTSSSTSGRRRLLPGGLILAREYDRFVLCRARGGGGGGFVDVPGPGEGREALALAGRSWRVEWSRFVPPSEGRWTETFASDRLRFPLRMRGWMPGDRIRLAYGSKKLKKLFAEARVPQGERHGRPVLADAAGAVLWVPGLARAEDAAEPGPETRLTIAVTETEPG